jgi:hypothetical protein
LFRSNQRNGIRAMNQTLCRGTGETSIRDPNRTLMGGDGEVVWIRAVVETPIRGDINQTKYEG